MSALCDLLDSGRYRAEVQRLGPVLARHALWLEADRRAREITDRLVPPKNFSAGFRFEHGGHDFVRRTQAKHAHEANRMIVLDYARDQILAKMERRVGMGQLAREMIK